MRSTPPPDSWNKAYCIFFLQGIGQLFPWNVFINAEDYFRRRLCGSAFENNFENFISAGYNIAAIAGLVLALRYQERWNLSGRIMGSLAVSMLTFLACGTFVLAEGIDSTLLFFWTLGLIIVSGLATAVLQGGLFSMASAFPPRYTQAMMAGQGLAGLAVALAGLFTTLAGPDDQSCIVDPTEAFTNSPLDSSSSSGSGGSGDGAFTDHHPARRAGVLALDGSGGPVGSPPCAAYTRDWGTLVYFGVAVVVLLGCMLTYPLLERLPLTAFYTRGGGGDDDEDGAAAESANGSDVHGLGGKDDGWLGVGHTAAVSSSLSPTGSSSMYRRLVDDTPPLRLLALGKPLSDSDAYERGGQGEGPKGDVGPVGPVGVNIATAAGAGGLRSRLAPISRYAFAVFLVFTVTLSVFPGATSEIVSWRRCQPGRSRFFAGDVFVMFSFVSFNSFDLLGRLAAGLARALPYGWLPTASVSRCVFVPLLLACRSENSRFRDWLSADAFPLILMPLFAFTNGYVGSLSMMAGSQKGAWAGTAMVLFLNGGLLAGSLLSFVVLFASTES
eukprot:g4853.t1